MYDVMVGIHESFKDEAGVSIKERNNMVLNAMRDLYKSAHGLRSGGGASSASSASGGTKRRSGATADRHSAAVFGDRPMVTMQIKPEAVPRSSISDSAIQHMHAERHMVPHDPEVRQSQPKQHRPLKEQAFDLEEFNSKLEHLRSARTSVPDVDGDTNPQEARLAQDREEFTKPVADHPHPKTIYEATVAEATAREDTRPPVRASAELVPRADFVVPPTNQTHVVEKYLIINGFDRDWNQNQERFRVVADFNSFSENDLQSRHKNIRSIALKRVIIPQEITETVSVGNIPRNTFVHPFNFSFPYVLITIDEIGDIYDGTNDAARRAFSPMIVDKHWRCKNGRGYLVLQCMQDEKKTFYPVPMSDLKRLTLTIRKPNGEMFNQSKDDYYIVKVEYESYNPQHLKIVLNKYFDKNEFFKGDEVKLRGVHSPSQTMHEFLNRPSGHEIMEMGQPNQSGFFKTFFVHAPGAFDANSGRFVVDLDAIEVHDGYNDTIDFTEPGCVNGDIMNMSLQCVFTFKLEEVVVDPGVPLLTV
jgi:hypothetical protein